MKKILLIFNLILSFNVFSMDAMLITGKIEGSTTIEKLGLFKNVATEIKNLYKLLQFQSRFYYKSVTYLTIEQINVLNPKKT